MRLTHKVTDSLGYAVIFVCVGDVISLCLKLIGCISHGHADVCGFYDSHVVFSVTDSHCLISCYIQDLSQLVKCHTFVNACFCEFQITVATAYERDFQGFFLQMLKYFVAAVVVIIYILWKIDGHFPHYGNCFRVYHFSDIVHAFSGCH